MILNILNVNSCLSILVQVQIYLRQKWNLSYYKIHHWSLYGDELAVSEDNDHIGLVVSRIDEEIKNFDKNIRSARDILFSLIGNIFSYECKLSPEIQNHTWSVFVKPILRSGLSALPITETALKPLTTLHLKIVCVLLRLIPYSPIAPLILPAW